MGLGAGVRLHRHLVHLHSPIILFLLSNESKGWSELVPDFPHLCRRGPPHGLSLLCEAMFFFFFFSPSGSSSLRRSDTWMQMLERRNRWLTNETLAVASLPGLIWCQHPSLALGCIIEGDSGLMFIRFISENLGMQPQPALNPTAPPHPTPPRPNHQRSKWRHSSWSCVRRSSLFRLRWHAPAANPKQELRIDHPVFHLLT